MYKVIHGSKYDTDTARRLTTWDNELEPGDLNYVMETLYRTRGGNYFLHGIGGARTRYNVRISDSRWRGGEEIRPLSYGAAQSWVEEHFDGDEYESIFGDPEEGKVTKTLQIAVAANRKLEQMQAEQGKTQAAIIEELLLGSEG